MISLDIFKPDVPVEIKLASVNKFIKRISRLFSGSSHAIGYCDGPIRYSIWYEGAVVYIQLTRDFVNHTSERKFGVKGGSKATYYMNDIALDGINITQKELLKKIFVQAKIWSAWPSESSEEDSIDWSVVCVSKI